MKSKTIAVILAGGKGERLEPLTRDRAKPAVPFGGAYRIIDFTLSNCFNSGVRRILMLTQYKSISLDRHIAIGWSRLFCREFGEFIDVVPPQQRIDASWYQGTADAVYQNIYSLEMERPEYVIILAGDHIYKMDYGKMLEFHRENQADLTVSVFPVSIETAKKQFGVIEIDANKRIIGFEEKPEKPKPIPDDDALCYASMGIYIFNAKFLFEELCRDAVQPKSRHDFGGDMIPRVIRTNAVYAFPFNDENSDVHQYWRDVGTLEAYYEANMDLVGIEPLLNLYDEKWPIYTWQPNYPPPKFLFSEKDRCGSAQNSLVCNGTIISGGNVQHSILGHQVRVNSFSTIENSILFSRVNIGRNVQIKNAIIDRDVQIPNGLQIGFDAEMDRMRGFHLTPSGLTVISRPCLMS